MRETKVWVADDRLHSIECSACGLDIKPGEGLVVLDLGRDKNGFAEYRITHSKSSCLTVFAVQSPKEGDVIINMERP